MKVTIQFNDENKELAKAIGMGLIYYGDPLAAAVARDLADKVTTTTEKSTTKKVGDLELTEKQTTKTEPVDEPRQDENGVLLATLGGPKSEPTKTITPDNKGPELIPPGPVETDEHGVPFDAAFCAVSKVKPFYATGPRTGQWKKKRGLDVDEYDIWYDGQRPTNNAAEPQDRPVDTAAAFATGGAGAVTATGDLPTTPGDLMKWCAEQTAAGAMTTEEVTAAYAACGITVADMFGADGPTHVKAVLAVLVK